MTTPRPAELKNFAVHTMTNKPWSLAECCDRYAAAGFGGISVWRNVIEPIGVDEAARIVKGSGLSVPALVRGGFFVSADNAKRQAATDDNKRCIDEAAALGAEMVVLVVGAEPGTPLDEARRQVAEGIGACMDHARANSVRLAIEPLHPMYAADKSCVNRIAEAREICATLGDPLVGVAVDVYHVWWDPDLATEIELLGREDRLFGFHVCDWRVNTRHLLTDRGLMGEGCIDIARIRAMVEKAGFTGLNEVEVFSEEHWAEDQDAYLATIADACLKRS
ncbi:sugar phosphate isomerase/epimerase family protein [Mucisphaera calidilacus]|uniref:Inosose isomerase n=1 Tax=Mucisphaera calidilacus TaxID=2527982 RepID=A0A518C0B2_9BACT|nr:sugar phosphate isomerase/epimerase family protein [Mucisphaera calidilacus]QDU72660.1 Inosose isomerase [Mucisphaera calidilacus]